MIIREQIVKYAANKGYLSPQMAKKGQENPRQSE